MGVFRQAARHNCWPVYLWGEAGRGKTSAAAVVYRKWRHGNAIWLTLSQFVAQVATCRSEGKVLLPGCSYETGEAGLWRSRVEAPGLLCVDDLGIRQPTEAQFAIVYELIDRRGTRPAIYTGNLSPDQLNRVYDGRIVSRLLRGIEVEVTGEDLRLQRSASVQV